MAQDVYKLAHQATLGSEHAVANEAGVRDWLAREMATLGAGPQEPLIDPISANGDVLRVHLRPYFMAGYPAEGLLEAFIRTARAYIGSQASLANNLQLAVRMAGQGGLNLGDRDAAEELMALVEHMRGLGFPAAHHSEPFERLYRPAYRVIGREFLPGELANL